MPLALLPALTFPAWSNQQKAQAPKAVQKTTAQKQAVKPAPAAPAKAAAASKAAPSAAAKGSTKKSAGSQRVSVAQQQPSQERIRQIQQALSEHGYPVEPTGIWGPQSIEALKKFQDERKINNMSGRGKLDPLTLIALGLGPRREPPPAAAVPPERAPTEGKQP